MDGENPIPVSEISKEERESPPEPLQTNEQSPQDKPPKTDRESPETKLIKQRRQEQELKDERKIHEILGSLEESKSQEKPSILNTKETVVSEKRGESYEFYEFSLPSGLPVRVVFKEREETIAPESISSKHVVHIGKEPQYLPDQEFKDWQKSFDGKDNAHLEHLVQQHRLDEYSQKGGLTMVVDQTPESIMEAALLLGAKDPKVREFYHQARNFQYSDKLLEQIDKAIAGHDLHRDGKDNLLGSSHDPEALLLASLLGDKEAEAELDREKSLYDKRYQKDMEAVEKSRYESKKEERTDEWWGKRMAEVREKLGPMKLEDLAAVHITNYYPKYDQESGKWKMQTTYSAREGEFPRTSLHFALNHSVTSHVAGSWDEKPIVIVAPMADLIKENGLPEVLRGVDTWWELNPGEDLVLPDSARILVPGKTSGELYTKASSLNTLRHKGPDQGIHKINYPMQSVAKFRDLERRHDQSVDVLLSEENDPERKEEQKQAEIELRGEVARELEKIAEARNRSVEEVITSLGYEVIRGGKDYWFDPDKQVQLRILADDLGLGGGMHSNSPQSEIEVIVNASIGRKMEGKVVNPTEEKASLKESISRIWPVLHIQQRRALWAMGLV